MGFYLLVVEGPVDLVVITSACIVTGHLADWISKARPARAYLKCGSRIRKWSQAFQVMRIRRRRRLPSLRSSNMSPLTEIYHYVLVAKEEHAGAGVVQLVHGSEVGHLAKIPVAALSRWSGGASSRWNRTAAAAAGRGMERHAASMGGP